jgi:hypothetical protein
MRAAISISLKYFSPRETRAGVTAKPFRRRQLFAGAFMRGGRFPDRQPLPLHGHMYQRAEGVTKWGGAIVKLRSGVIIPYEMITGATEAVFYVTVERALPKRLEHEIGRVLAG